MARNPWKKLHSNIMLSAKYGSHGGRSETNPKLSGRLYHRDAANTSQSTRRHEVTVNFEDLEKQFNVQGGKCFWFGIPLNPMDIFKVRYPLALSVDRLENDKGYIHGNIVITCRLANLGRQSCSVSTYRGVVNKIKYMMRKKKPLDSK